MKLRFKKAVNINGVNFAIGEVHDFPERLCETLLSRGWVEDPTVKPVPEAAVVSPPENAMKPSAKKPAKRKAPVKKKAPAKKVK